MKKLQEIKLSTWAKDNNMPYKSAWNLAKTSAFPAKIKKTDTGRIVVLSESKASVTDINASFGKMAVPLSASSDKQYEATASTTRRNKAATSTPTDEYFHIRNGISPFNLSKNNLNCNEAIKLCQQCYYNFSIFRSTIDLMSEFSTNKLYFREGNAKSKKFFTDWLETINILDLQDKFFRELYRSSNVFIYRFDAELGNNSTIKLNEAYLSEAAKDTKLPISYIILNPADIQVNGIMFSDSTYFKALNSYEVGRLRNPQTEQEQKFFNSLDEKTKQEIKSGIMSILLPLDPKQINVVFYKKQDYEPMAVPMAYSVLKDINWKAEMKHIDMAVSRTMQNVVLLIKMGYESKNGEYMYDQNAANAMKELFASESAVKTLVADFTTDVKFAIPTIGDFLDPKKYQIVNEDIKTGLNHILSGSNDTKFANQYIQVQLFIQRLQQARELFLNKFLIPEMKRISNDMKFKAVPIPFFEDIDLKDTAEFDRIVAQLYQYGLLAPSETLKALETGQMPDKEESELEQENFKKLKDKGYYEPIVGGPATQKSVIDMTNKQQTKMQENQLQHDNKQKTKELKHKVENPDPAPVNVIAPILKQQRGKPAGKAGPNSKTRKSSPMKASEFHSLSKIKDNIILSMELDKEIEKTLLKKHKIKELNEQQIEIKNEISNIIIANEVPELWKESVEKYIQNPVNTNEERLNQIDEIGITHGVSERLASILLASRTEEEEITE